jgi:hypothetical protein
MMWGNAVKEDEMGRACSTPEIRNAYEIVVRKPKA